jgi:hypothetical protein
VGLLMAATRVNTRLQELEYHTFAGDGG